MRHIPHFRLQTVACLLAIPDLVHNLECSFSTRNWEEFVFASIDEKRWLRTSETCDMGIIHILAQGGNTVGKTTVLTSSVFQGQLYIAGNHPTTAAVTLMRSDKAPSIQAL